MYPNSFETGRSQERFQFRSVISRSQRIPREAFVLEKVKTRGVHEMFSDAIRDRRRPFSRGMIIPWRATSSSLTGGGVLMASRDKICFLFLENAVTAATIDSCTFLFRSYGIPARSAAIQDNGEQFGISIAGGSRKGCHSCR